MLGIVDSQIIINDISVLFSFELGAGRFLLFDRGRTAVEQKKPPAGDRRLSFEAAPYEIKRIYSGLISA